MKPKLEQRGRQMDLPLTPEQLWDMYAPIHCAQSSPRVEIIRLSLW